MHANTLKHTYIHAHTHTYVHICVYSYTHNYIHTYIHACIGPATVEAKKPAHFAWEATQLKPAQRHQATTNALTYPTLTDESGFKAPDTRLHPPIL